VAEVVQGRRRNGNQLEAKNGSSRPHGWLPRDGVFRGAHRPLAPPLNSTVTTLTGEREQRQSMAEETWHGGEQGGILKESEDGQSATHLVHKELGRARGEVGEALEKSWRDGRGTGRLSGEAAEGHGLDKRGVSVFLHSPSSLLLTQLRPHQHDPVTVRRAHLVWWQTRGEEISRRRERRNDEEKNSCRES
jgi:hypothetical protein